MSLSPECPAALLTCPGERAHSLGDGGIGLAGGFDDFAIHGVLLGRREAIEPHVGAVQLLGLAGNQLIERLALALDALRHGSAHGGAAASDDLHDDIARLLGLLCSLSPGDATARGLQLKLVGHGLNLSGIGQACR